MWYILFRGLFRILFRWGYRYQVIGHENIPKEGAVLICSNHISNLDPPLVGSSMQRKVSYMAKESLFKIPIVSFLIKRFGAFPVKRGVQDKQALRTAMGILKEGQVLGIFPEGTRSKTGRLGKPLPGAGMFALKEDSVVIPVAILGPYAFFKGLRIVFGEPVKLDDLKQGKITSEATRKASDRIMDSIQKLLDQYNKVE